MRVLIMGAAGMVGQKLLNGTQNVDIGLGDITKIYLHDMVPWQTPHLGLARAKYWLAILQIQQKCKSWLT